MKRGYSGLMCYRERAQERGLGSREQPWKSGEGEDGAGLCVRVRYGVEMAEIDGEANFCHLASEGAGLQAVAIVIRSILACPSTQRPNTFAADIGLTQGVPIGVSKAVKVCARLLRADLSYEPRVPF